MPGFAPDRAAAMLASGDANAVLLVPTMISMMVEYLRQHPADLSGVTDIFYGASPISDALLRDAMAAFPSARFYQGYGQRSEENTSELQSLMRISYAVSCMQQKITTKLII